MELYLICLPFALLLPLIAKFVFPHRITFKEYLSVTVANIILIIIISTFSNLISTYDTEIWSGQVTKKYSEKVSCEHSYLCRCRQMASGRDSKGNTTYTTVCDTCFEHAYDVSWRVKSNVGDDTISRVDRRGLKEPPRFTEIKIGEPYATTYSFKNYILASPDTLYVNSKALKEKYLGSLPDYPSIYDYYKIVRVFGVGVPFDSELNTMLNEAMREWGPKKQANVIVVLVSEKYSQEYYQALQSHWLGGKKNDIVIVSQIGSDKKVNWTRVFSRADQGSFDKSVEMDLTNMGQYDAKKYVDIINENVMKRFKRIDFEKFKYLLDDYKPSTTSLIVGFIIALLFNLGLNFLMFKKDVFGDEWKKRRRY